MTAAVQYAVLLNGRLVGDTPFVFESRGAAERLVRLLGDLTGARASAVQRGWLVPDAPPFCLDRVSRWLDAAGPGLTRRGHVPSISTLDASLPDLSWPPDAWHTREPEPSAASRTMHWAGEIDPRTPAAVHPSYLDGVDGSLWDIYAQAHDLDDWEDRLPRKDRQDIIPLGDGWMEVITFPQPLYGLSFPAHLQFRADHQSHDVDIDELQTTRPDPVDMTVNLPPQFMFDNPLDTFPEEAPPMVMNYTFQDGTRRLFGSALRFRSEHHRDSYLAALQQTLGEKVAAVRSFAAATTPQSSELAAWLVSQGLPQPDADALARRLEDIEQGMVEAERHEVDQTRLRSGAAQRLQLEQAERQRQAVAQQAELQRQAVIAEEERAEQARVRQEKERQILARQRQEAIRRVVEERGITQLTHFTRVENLTGILQNGIISRKALPPGQGVWNDDWRGDRRLHASCLSISHPNYRMFYRYRQQNEGNLWAVLVLEPRVLWELDCGFVEVNAAKSGVPEREEGSLKTVEALTSMFSNIPLRDTLKLPQHHTTDPQAEVLVFETVPVEYIREVQVNFVPNVNRAKDRHGRDIPVIQRTALFDARQDYAYWSSQ